MARGLFLALVVALGIIFGTGAPPDVRAQGRAPQGMSPQAAAQIAALLAEKASRTPSQRKIDSQLVYGAKMARRQAIAAGVQSLAVNLSLTAEGRVTIDVRADISDALLERFRALGIGVVSTSTAFGSVRLQATFTQIEAIAAFSEVYFIQPKAEAVTARIASAAAGQPLASIGAVRRTARRGIDRGALAAVVRRAVARQDAGTSVGSVTSEGDLTHKAANARSTYGIDGTGVKIGILSDGACAIATSQGAGDLGTVTVVPGQVTYNSDCATYNYNEGTALLEIVHDLAPGAQLYFATAFNGIASFADNIRALRNTYGCDVIIDDVFYFVETPFQDGQASPSQTNGGAVIQAVKDVTAAGALYFSSAGNGGNLDAGTSGTWEGDFVDGGPTSLESGCTAQGCRIHNFGAQTYDVLNASGLGVMTLQWADPLGRSSDDYDLFLLDSTGTSVLFSSTNVQDGTQDPFEAFSAAGSFPVGSRVVILKWTGASRFLHLGAVRGRLSIATSGEIRGHSATTGENSFGVAATPARSPGPSPNPFSSGNTVETFSSDGPRRIFFNADGSAINPDLSSSGGFLLQKPDLTAADRVSVTGAGGFGTVFSGTSAAAPHAGAIAALIKSANPSLTASQVRAALLGSAIDIQAAGVDRDSGAGIVMADTAVQSVIAVPASEPHMAIDAPSNASSPVQPFQMSGWAIDRGALSSTGVDTVHVYTYPSSGPPIFMGVASYGGVRNDIGGLYGARFTNSGFSQTVSGLAAGSYTLVAFAHSTITGTFNQSRTVPVTLTSTSTSAPAMSLDAPGNGSVLSSLYVAGWAIDLAAPNGTGVDAIHVWAYPNPGSGQSPVFVGAASYGGARADVGLVFGSRFANSGFFLAISGVPAGTYRIAAFAHSTFTGTFNAVRIADITLLASTLMSIDAPPGGASRSQPFFVSGWAIDRSAVAGPGVDAIHIWAYPVGVSGGPFFAGAGGYGAERGDVGAAFGSQFTNSGYNTYITGLAAGTYDLVVYAHSTVSGTFNQAQVVRVTVQ